MCKVQEMSRGLRNNVIVYYHRSGGQTMYVIIDLNIRQKKIKANAPHLHENVVK